MGLNRAQKFKCRCLYSVWFYCGRYPLAYAGSEMVDRLRVTDDSPHQSHTDGSTLPDNERNGTSPADSG
jgi:hypothetical protein